MPPKDDDEILKELETKPDRDRNSVKTVCGICSSKDHLKPFTIPVRLEKGKIRWIKVWRCPDHRPVQNSHKKGGKKR